MTEGDAPAATQCAAAMVGRGPAAGGDGSKRWWRRRGQGVVGGGLFVWRNRAGLSLVCSWVCSVVCRDGARPGHNDG